MLIVLLVQYRKDKVQPVYPSFSHLNRCLITSADVKVQQIQKLLLKFHQLLKFRFEFLEL
jgi:hypothetical protein